MMPSSSADAAFRAHDHGRCRGRALSVAVEECRARGLRLTPARTFALEVLLESHRATTAYELLDRMREADLGSQPPVAYRALEFLVANGFAHRIERLGAYVACTGAEPGAHPAGFMVCRECRRVAEIALAEPPPDLDAQAAASEFSIERIVLEAEGLCGRCRDDAA